MQEYLLCQNVLEHAKILCMFDYLRCLDTNTTDDPFKWDYPRYKYFRLFLGHNWPVGHDIKAPSFLELSL